MIIGGLEKLSLSDYPGKVSCVVFVVGCNFGCQYCHNPDLISLNNFEKSKRKSISKEYIYKFLEKNKKFLDCVTITGGEPTLFPELIDFVKKIGSMGYKIKLDTNGSNPTLLKELIDNNLIDYIAMDVKAPFYKYRDVTESMVDILDIQKSISMIKLSNIDHEFRTTISDKLLEVDFFLIKDIVNDGSKWFIQSNSFNGSHSEIVIKGLKEKDFFDEKIICREYHHKR